MLQLAVQTNNTDKQPDVHVCVCARAQTAPSSLFGGVSLHGAQDLHLGESASCSPQSCFSVSEAQDLPHVLSLLPL